MAVTGGNPIYASDLNLAAAVSFASTVVTANSGSITTTTTSVASLTASLTNGAVYGLWFYGRISSSVAADIAYVRIHPTSVGTTELNICPVYIPTTTTAGYGIALYAEYTASATGSLTFLASLQRNTGTGNIILRASSAGPAYLTCRRITPYS